MKKIVETPHSIILYNTSVFTKFIGSVQPSYTKHTLDILIPAISQMKAEHIFRLE